MTWHGYCFSLANELLLATCDCAGGDGTKMFVVVIPPTLEGLLSEISVIHIKRAPEADLWKERRLLSLFQTPVKSK